MNRMETQIHRAPSPEPLDQALSALRDPRSGANSPRMGPFSQPTTVPHPKLESRNSKPETPYPDTLSIQPEARNSNPETPHPNALLTKPKTRNPKPEIRNLDLQPRNQRHQIPNPELNFETLNPKRHTIRGAQTVSCATTGVPRSSEPPPPGGSYNSPIPRDLW